MTSLIARESPEARDPALPRISSAIDRIFPVRSPTSAIWKHIS